MNTRKICSNLFVAFIGIISVHLLAGCSPTAIDFLNQIKIEGELPSAGAQPSKEDTTIWVEHHIVLLGSRSAITEIAEVLELEPVEEGETLEIGQLITQDYTLEQDQERLLELLSQALGTTITEEILENIFAANSETAFIAELYQFEAQERAVTDVIEFVDDRREEFPEDYRRNFIFAQPNFWVTPSAAHSYTVCSAPHPSSIGGGPFGDPIAGASEEQFQNQAAFMHLTQDDLDRFGEGAGGEGVKITIIDTSPFKEDEPVDPALIDDVTYRNPGTDAPSMLSPKNEHGLFVAALVRTVAPKSSIELIRLLDSNGCGMVYTLNGGIYQELFTGMGKEEKFVINLSLVYKIDGPEGSAKDHLGLLLMGIPDDRPNTIVVAAAGNEGTGKQPLYPAAYYTQTHVLAVAATNQDSEPSCFSNQGSVKASGGEGENSESEPDDEGNGTLCAPSPKPEHNLISIVTSNTSQSGYAWWSGTSFATSLVSGIAARCLSNEYDAAKIKSILENTFHTDPVTLGICPPPE